MYTIYKLAFQTDVHFGNGLLNDTEICFRADTLFSALYQEAIKQGVQEELWQMTDEGGLRFSNAFPYRKKTYFLPKPMLYVKSTKQTDPGERKLYKKLKYLPVEEIDAFLCGTLDVHQIDQSFGSMQMLTKAAVRREEETDPYQVGTFRFSEDCGLYFICKYEKKEQDELVGMLFDALSYVGIGGKRSAGLGKFEAIRAKVNEALERALRKTEEQEASRLMLLSNALPRDEELEDALSGAAYLLDKRSGFVDSVAYAPTLLRKKDLYTFCAGSCFQHGFDGDIFHVELEGAHPVYRYAKAVFIGL